MNAIEPIGCFASVLMLHALLLPIKVVRLLQSVARRPHRHPQGEQA